MNNKISLKPQKTPTWPVPGGAGQCPVRGNCGLYRLPRYRRGPTPRQTLLPSAAERRFQPVAGSPSSRWSRPMHVGRSRSKKKSIVRLLLAASYSAAATMVGTGGAMRSNSIPKGMLAIYQNIVGLTDDVCERQLTSEYRDLARSMTGAL